MKLIGAFTGRRKPAIGKAFYVRELRGQLIVCKWPRKRGRPLHPTTLAQMEKFKQANWMTKYVPAAIQAAHRKIVKGTNLLPRDLMIASMYGRGFDFVIPGHRRRYPIAAIQDLSATLDILGALAGDVMARGPDLWQKVRPNAVGEVLTSQGPGLLPEFQTPPTGGGGWVELSRETLIVGLGLGVYKDITVPSNFEQLQFLVDIPYIAGGVRPRVKTNGGSGTDYRGGFVENFGTTSLRAQMWNPLSTWLFLTTIATPLATNISLNMYIRPFVNAKKLWMNFSLFGASGYQVTGGGMHNNTPQVDTITVKFQSDQGNGLPAGTRFITRAVLP